MEAENALDFDAVIETFDHPRYELIGTDREFRCRMTAFFVFGAGRDDIECERVYFDSATILRQLVS